MSEKLHLAIQSNRLNDSSIYTITTANFDQVADANGNFPSNRKPTVTIVFSNASVPSGFTFTWDFGLDNWAKRATVTVSHSGTSDISYTFVPTLPYMTDDWNVWGAAPTKIVCVVHQAQRPNMKLNFGGFELGENCVDFSTGIQSCKIAQSTDPSGQSAPYSVLEAVINGRAIDSFFAKHKKLVAATTIKEIGYFYMNSIGVYKASQNGVSSYKLIAYSAIGTIADRTYSGHLHSDWTIYPTTAADVFATIVANITGGIFDTNAPAVLSQASFNGRCFPNIREGVDNRAALAAVAMSCACFLDPDGMMRPIGGYSTANPIVIPQSRIYASPIIEDIGELKSLEISAYEKPHRASGDTGTGDTEPGQYHTRSVYRGYDTLEEEQQWETWNTTGQAVSVDGAQHALYKYDFFKTVSVNGERAITVDGFSIPSWKCGWIDNSDQTISQYIFNALYTYYSRHRVWKGKVLWNTTTNECRLGAHVTVYTADGSTFTGIVISSNLNFSGASVSAELQVIEDPEE